MKILTQWLRDYLPGLAVSDAQLAEDLTLRGIAVEGIFDLGPGNGSLFETDITTNRVDAMNHYGIAREAAAIYGLQLPALSPPHVQPAPPHSGGAGGGLLSISVSIDAPDLCGRFTARVLRGVTIQSSTGLVASRFHLLGQKQISNAVDATNYAMLAIGQPAHAFDLDKLHGGIVVRRARRGERLKLLDGTERTLDAEDLVVADEQKALALAGVMGGWDSMITAETKNILVEAAWFDPAAIRRSSRRHNLHTDASHRYERGTDFNGPPIASSMVTNLILEAGGHVEGSLIDIAVADAEARTAKRPAVSLAVTEVQRLLGTTADGNGIAAATIGQVLSALGCTLSPAGPGQSLVALPSWRLDLEREIDLIEEVARVYGYNRFANTLPAFTGTVVALPHATRTSTVRTLMLASGFHEAVTSTFSATVDAELFAPQPGLGIAMGNPLNAEAGMLRPSLAPGLLAAVEHSLNRNIDHSLLFEIGAVFSGNTDRVDEKPALGFIATGPSPSTGPQHAARPFDFYDAKGLVESIVEKFQHRSFYVDAFSLPAWLHPGRAARAVVDGLTAGYFGQLHPAEAQKRKLRQSVIVGELSLDRLFQLPLRQPRPQELSRFQPVARDFSALFPVATRWEQIADALASLQIASLVSYLPREVFHPKQSDAGEPRYSLLLSTVFQAPDRTLREEEVQAWSQQVVSALETLGGRLRSEATSTAPGTA